MDLRGWLVHTAAAGICCCGGEKRTAGEDLCSCRICQCGIGDSIVCARRRETYAAGAIWGVGKDGWWALGGCDGGGWEVGGGICGSDCCGGDSKGKNETKRYEME